MQQLLTDISRQCGIVINHHHAVHGGDINEASCLYTDNGKYFLKLNRSDTCPGLFRSEAAGLLALESNCALKVPSVMGYGESGTKQYLLLEWMELGVEEDHTMMEFGRALAAMHRIVQPCFGFTGDNYIGTLPQKNKQYSNWSQFYAAERILPLARQLFNSGVYSKQEMNQTESLCKKMDSLFPEEPPCLLHGDLWSGNYLISANGSVCIFDPAVYYGHREMDIGMSLLFGGFSHRFYQSYHEYYPLQNNWQQRTALTQLYPLLVHAILFGGHYTGKTKEIISYYA